MARGNIIEKGLTILLSGVMILSLIGCGNNSSVQLQNAEEPMPSQAENESSGDMAEGDGKILIAYFSRWGNTDFPEDVDAMTSASIVLGQDGNLQGNTAMIASLIQEETGGDIHLIETAETYPEDYDATVEQNRREQNNDIIPELSGFVGNIEQYDTVFIGYPIWATTLPRPVVSFLSQYDLSGKRVIPFCTHAGYGSGDSYEKIRELCPDADVADGLSIHAEDLALAAGEIETWLAGLDVTEKEIEDRSEAMNVIITTNDVEIHAELNDSEAAREFAGRLPVTVSMTRMGEHEYYGGLDTPLAHTEDIQTGYTVGDLAFWTPGDLLAIYFDEPERQPEGLMILGHITSDISVFDDMQNFEEMRIELVQ